MDKFDLAPVVNDATRRIKVRGKQVIVPLKYDKQGRPVKAFHLYKRLSLDDLRFLDAYRESDWDLEAAAKKANISPTRLPWLKKHLDVFRQEDAITRSKAQIPSVAYVTAKHVDNVEGAAPLDDSQQKSLDALAKIQGAYKNSTTLNLQQNVFNLPKLAPEIEAQFKELAEKALDTEAENAA